jgi:hypothetical protein
MGEGKEKKYLTIHNCPPEIHEAARLWKPVLGMTINKILIEMLLRGAEQMQETALEKAREKFNG